MGNGMTEEKTRNLIYLNQHKFDYSLAKYFARLLAVMNFNQ